MEYVSGREAGGGIEWRWVHILLACVIELAFMRELGHVILLACVIMLAIVGSCMHIHSGIH